MYQYDIKISGKGSSREIIESLQGIIDSISEAVNSDHDIAILDGAIWEDDILITEILAN